MDNVVLMQLLCGSQALTFELLCVYLYPTVPCGQEEVKVVVHLEQDVVWHHADRCFYFTIRFSCDQWKQMKSRTSLHELRSR